MQRDLSETFVNNEGHVKRIFGMDNALFSQERKGVQVELCVRATSAVIDAQVAFHGGVLPQVPCNGRRLCVYLRFLPIARGFVHDGRTIISHKGVSITFALTDDGLTIAISGRPPPPSLISC